MESPVASFVDLPIFPNFISHRQEPDLADQNDESQHQPEDEGCAENQSPDSVLVDIHDMKPATKRTWQLRKSFETLPKPEEEPTVNRKLFHDHGDDDGEQTESEPEGMEQDPEALEIGSEQIPLTQPDHGHEENNAEENAEQRETGKDEQKSQDHETQEMGISKGTRFIVAFLFSRRPILSWPSPKIRWEWILCEWIMIHSHLIFVQDNKPLVCEEALPKAAVEVTKRLASKENNADPGEVAKGLRSFDWKNGLFHATCTL